ncbi:MAG: HD-GYP domain-containing protein [Firmicutes bacterium]|nr:HD-GYP domain-containing protein [Bacillota bacterium]
MIAVGVAAAGYGLFSPGIPAAPVLLFCLISPMTHVLPIKWYSFTVTLGPAVEMAGSWLFGPAAACIVAIAGRVFSAMLMRPLSRRGWMGLWGEAPSIAVAGIATVAAGHLYRFLGWVHGMGVPDQGPFNGAPGDLWLASRFLSAALYFLVIVLLTLPGLHARFGSRFASLWWGEWAEIPVGFPLNFAAALLLAWLYPRTRVGMSGLIVFTLFLAMIVYSTRMFVRMSEVYRSTVETLVPVIEAKFPNGVGHSRRVSNLAVAVARKMALPKPEIRNLFFGAMLHDVGIAAIDERILLKKAALSMSEYLDLLTHTIEGAKIVSKSAFLTGCAEIVLHHHERFDGTGHPHKLAGEDIPLGARIVAIAEAYDAMTHSRPFSPAMEPVAALAEMRAQASKQFDPAIIPYVEQAVQEQLRWGEHVFEFNYVFDIDR